MPLKTAYQAKVEYLQIMDENGVVDEKLAKDAMGDQDILELYQYMIKCRVLDETAFKLQRS